MTADRAPSPGGAGGQWPLDASTAGCLCRRAGQGLGAGVFRPGSAAPLPGPARLVALGCRTHDGEQASVEAGIEAAFGPGEALSDTSLGWRLLGQNGQQHLVLGRPQGVGRHPGATDGNVGEFRVEFGGGVVQLLHQAAGP